MAWSKTEILAATGGRLWRDGKAKRFGEVVTDSTKVRRGSIFVALKGGRHDGHEFIADALRGGASCVIAHRLVPRLNYQRATVVKVRDTLTALGDLAHFRREQLAPKVLAITGSNGKTTTKEMLAAILDEAVLGGEHLRGCLLKTEGNFNNLVGLPLTLLRLRKHHKFAVLELGTNRPGEIRRLAEIADPDSGLITSVAAAHLEGLSSLAGVAREKGALYEAVRPGGVIGVNVDDARVKKLAAKFNGKKITYGKRGWLRAGSCRMSAVGGTNFTLHAGAARSKIHLNYLGQHNITNALAATALAVGAGVELPAIRRGLAKAKPYSMRMQIEKWNRIGIINDAYNANPASMRAALQTLAGIQCPGKRIAVLGDMFELGRRSTAEHRALGRAAANAKIDGLYLLGAQADAVRKGAVAGGLAAAKIFIGKDHGDLAGRMRQYVQPGDWLLFKGSRGMQMERVLEALKGGRA